MRTITGGEQVGNNLFFLLEEFSVSENEEITFESAIDVENIFIEIAGNEPSIVNGLLKATGKSDIFFANPDGIIFNENSRLEIEGSFLATTANSIDFADGTTLVVGQDNSNAGLTDSIPIGLNFLGDNASINVNGNGSQINRLESNQFDRGNNPDLSQLTVEPDKTLALIGGEIKIEGGSLTAASGHIELGGINEGIVALNQDAEKLTLGFEIALGDRNEDISILVSKIESAKLFSRSIDTQKEIEVYQGLSGESFGRNWLDEFGETVSSQAQVDSALIDLVNG